VRKALHRKARFTKLINGDVEIAIKVNGTFAHVCRVAARADGLWAQFPGLPPIQVYDVIGMMVGSVEKMAERP
jgi:hypothetical protein